MFRTSQSNWDRIFGQPSGIPTGWEITGKAKNIGGKVKPIDKIIHNAVSSKGLPGASAVEHFINEPTNVSSVMNEVKKKSPVHLKKMGIGARAGKTLKKAAGGLGMFGGAALLGVGMAVTTKVWDSIQWEQPGTRRSGSGYGPGFISWSKTSGMPANNLGTKNLPEALHRTRHSSNI